MHQPVAEWCEDLVLVAKHAGWFRHLHWLRPTSTRWGREVASAALRAFDALCSEVRGSPTDEVLPYIFDKVTLGSALMMWQPALLSTSRRCPRPHDPTYAASRYRESLGVSITYLECVVEANEEPGLVIRVRDTWICHVVH